MTDRHAGYVVTLGKDIREDDAERIVTALSMVKGVISVEPILGDYAVQIATARARLDFANRLGEAIEQGLSGRDMTTVKGDEK